MSIIFTFCFTYLFFQQNKCNNQNLQDKYHFSQWVMELRSLFSMHGLLLSAAVSPNPEVIDMAYDINIVDNLDWVGVMSYDYHGQWDKKTGHIAPLYSHSGDENQNFNLVN